MFPILLSSEAGLPGLVIDLPKLIAQIVTFLVFFAVVYVFLFKAILGMLEARKAGIQKVLDETEKGRVDTERLREDLQKRLAEIDEERRRQISEAVKRGEEIRQEIMRRTDEEIAKARGKLQRDTELERFALEKAVREDLARTSILLAERLLRQSVDRSVQARLVEEFLKEQDGRRAG
jgi:F-type H+-transporting ATPase subunit b